MLSKYLTENKENSIRGALEFSEEFARNFHDILQNHRVVSNVYIQGIQTADFKWALEEIDLVHVKEYYGEAAKAIAWLFASRVGPPTPQALKLFSPEQIGQNRDSSRTNTGEFLDGLLYALVAGDDTILKYLLTLPRESYLNSSSTYPPRFNFFAEAIKYLLIEYYGFPIPEEDVVSPRKTALDIAKDNMMQSYEAPLSQSEKYLNSYSEALYKFFFSDVHDGVEALDTSLTAFHNKFIKCPSDSYYIVAKRALLVAYVTNLHGIPILDALREQNQKYHKKKHNPYDHLFIELLGFPPL